MSLPIPPHDPLAEAERHRAQLERLREEVSRLEEAEQFAEALQAIRDSGLVPADPAGLQPDIARLRQASRLQASYRRARAAFEAGDEEAGALLATVVAVDPTYKDAARLLYETVSGGRVAGLEAELAASREAASLAEAQRDRLARGRARLLRVAVAQGIVLCALCALLGWASRRRPPSPANGSAHQAPSGEARAARRSASGLPEAIAPTTMGNGPTSPGPAAPIAQAATPPIEGSPAATSTPAPEDRPLELDGPCHPIGESCWSTAQCCFGSMCYGTTCQDTRRTIVFGQYRP